MSNKEVEEVQITLIPETTEKDLFEADERVKNILARMSMDLSYWGFLFCRVAREPDVSMPFIMGVGATAEGRIKLFYNPIMVLNVTEKDLRVVIEHEGYHLLNKHLQRALRHIGQLKGKDGQHKMMQWNIAADCAVNEQLKAPEELIVFNKPYKLHFPKMHNLPAKHATEFYYERLMQAKPNPEPCSGDHGEGGQPCDGSCGQNPGQGQSPGQGDMIGDHGKWTEAAEGTSDPSNVARKVEQYTKNIVSDTARKFLNNKAVKQRGTAPGGLEELLRRFLEPPSIPYYEIIRRLVKGSRLAKWKRSLTKINRKRVFVFNDDDDPEISPFPGKARDYSFKVCIICDTSGSMSPKDIGEALSGCKSIMEKDRNCRIHVIECDTQIHKEYEIKKIDDIDFKVKGRGGTRMMPAVERAKELKADITFMFTDGYTEDMNQFPVQKFPKKMVWVISKRGTDRNCNRRGICVHLDDVKIDDGF